MKVRLLLLPGIAVLLALGAMAAACGGGDDGLTAEEYFQRLESLGNDINQRSEALGDQWQEQLESITSEEEVMGLSRDFYTDMVSLTGDFRDRLEDIDPPEEVRDAHDEFKDVAGALLETSRDIADQLQEAESEAEFLDLTTSEALRAVGERFDEACSSLKRIAADMGIEVDLDCGG
jgi:hypothetical protein